MKVVIIALGLACILLVGSVVGCANVDISWQHQQAMAMEITSSTFSTSERYSMLVLYERETDYFLQAIRGTHDFWAEGDKLYMDGEVIVNDTVKVGWGLYPEQKIERKYEDGEFGEPIEVPQTLEELNLRDFTAGDLPRSAHFVRLDAIHPESVLKAEVSRYYNSQWFTGIRCLVTLGVLQSYQAGDVEIGDYLWVYYTNDPRPGHEDQEIPVVVDKVMYP